MDIDALNNINNLVYNLQNQINELQQQNQMLHQQNERLIIHINELSKNYKIEIEQIKNHYETKLIHLSSTNIVDEPINPPNTVISMLKNAVKQHALVYDKHLNEYTGFNPFININNDNFNFKNIYLNRIINPSVINRRVKINKQYYEQHKRFKNFGTLKFVVIHNDDPENSNTFWVIDGQHRIEVLKKLINAYPREKFFNENVTANNINDIHPELKFIVNSTVTVLNSKEEFKDFMRLYQQQQQIHINSFSSTEIEKHIKEKLRENFRSMYPKTFNKIDDFEKKHEDADERITSSYNRRVHTPPHLTDNIIDDLYSNINIFQKLNSDGSSYILDNLEIIEKINSDLIEVKFNSDSNRRIIQRFDNCCYSYIYYMNDTQHTFAYINNKEW